MMLMLIGRKSMPSSRLDLQGAATPLAEVKPSSGILVAPSPAPRKEKPTLLTDFMRRFEHPTLHSASSSESLSAYSSEDNTPTRYKPKGKQYFSSRDYILIPAAGLPHVAPRSRAVKRPSHRLQIVHGLVSNEDEEGRFENQFQVLGELGRGQFGDVLRVKDRLRDLEYAVKKSQRYEGVRHRYVDLAFLFELSDQFMQ